MNEDPLTEYEDPAKAIAWAAMWEGYKYGYHVETYDRVDYQTANTRFEQWWGRNM